MWVGADYFVWCVVEVLVFDGYVYYSYAGSFNDGGTVADFWVNFDVWMLYFCFLQCAALCFCDYVCF
jgi:hypothetical protein